MVARVYVEAPPVTPRPYGLYSVAVVVDTANGAEGMDGIQYEPAPCAYGVHETPAACTTDTRLLGDLSVSVDDAALATLTATGIPDGSYVIAWGDDVEDVEDESTLSGATHTYAAPGDYAVVITGPDGWAASGTVTVTDGVATGPFTLTASYSKVVDTGVPLVEGEPVTLYHLFRCKRVGRTDFRDRAEASIRLGESRAVERVLNRQMRLAAVDLTPVAGTAVSVEDGVALLEGYAARFYGGVPVIHAPAVAGSLMGSQDVIERVSTRLETTLGALVSAGGGYDNPLGPPTDPEDPDTGVVAGAGEAWLYVTGTVLVRRTPVEVAEALNLAPASNDYTVLAERSVVPAWECITAAVLVSTPTVTV